MSGMNAGVEFFMGCKGSLTRLKIVLHIFEIDLPPASRERSTSHPNP
jgi:hypothetical protein